MPLSSRRRTRNPSVCHPDRGLQSELRDLLFLSMAQLLADDAAERGFQRLLYAPNVLPKSGVDQALIVAAAGPVHLLPKPVENVVIEPYGDSGLALGHRHDGSAFCVAEVVFTFHCFPRIAASRAGSLAARR